MKSNRITKWHTDRISPADQKGVDHFTIDGSDVSDRCTAYRTEQGNLVVLVYGKKEFGFISIDQLLSIYKNDSNLRFKGMIPHQSIRKAIESGRHVYGFNSIESMIKFKSEMIKA
jgi:hypothetical protein